MRILIFLAFSLVLFGCSASSANQKYKLPSGREIAVTGVQRVRFAEGDALVLSYETSIPIESHDELKSEVEEVWTVFRDDAEQAGVRGAAIRATHFEQTGTFSKSGKGYGFLFEKQADGQWQLKEDSK